MDTNKKRTIMLAVFLVALAAALAAVWWFNRPASSQGGKTITIEVVHKDESKKTFTCKTDEEYLAGALVAEGIVEDDPFETGMFFVVDGETADYERDKSYWAVYEDGGYASLGITELPIQDGGVYSLVYTCA